MYQKWSETNFSKTDKELKQITSYFVDMKWDLILRYDFDEDFAQKIIMDWISKKYGAMPFDGK